MGTVWSMFTVWLHDNQHRRPHEDKMGISLVCTHLRKLEMKHGVRFVHTGNTRPCSCVLVCISDMDHVHIDLVHRPFLVMTF